MGKLFMDMDNPEPQIDFSTLNGLQTVEQVVTTKWLVTGVANGIDMSRMSITADRRDFAPGISGRHTSEEEKTSFLELAVQPQAPPPFSYMLTLSAPLKEADICPAGDAVFSGLYYNNDETYSQRIVAHNKGFLESGNYDAIKRFSAAALKQENSYQKVHALFPSAIPKTRIEKIEPLGPDSPPVQIRWPDGKVESTSAYYK